MKADAALVQSVFDFAIREINALEDRIVRTEDDADAMLWEQTRQVVAQLNAGLSQRQLAKQWINARTGKPYDERHVRFVRQVFEQGAELTPRPRFRDAYNEIANAPPPGRHAHLTGEYEWYTPPEIIDAARAVMGGIDLDPASCPHANAIVQAAQYFTQEDNGLERDWGGRVFLNPPFAHPTVKYFAEKLLASTAVTEAVWLSNACVETGWWHALAAQGVICCPRGRVKFYTPDGRDGQGSSPTLPQTIIYLGPHRDAFCRRFADIGLVLVRP
jgi:hypothetical protein